MNQNFDNSAPNHIDVGATLARLEPGVATVPVEMSLASIAISLARASVTLSNIETVLRTNKVPDKLDDIRYAVNTVSNNGQSASGVAGAMNAHLNNIGRVLEELLKHAQGSNNPPR